MDYSLQIQKILVKVDAQKHPNDKIKLYKEAIQLADLHNDVEWGFDLRKELIEIEKETSRCVEGMPALTWILEAYDNNSDIFDETEFMMEYKWMMQAACRNVNISAQQLEQIFEDYKTRLLRNGYTLHSYYRTKAQLAFMLGKYDDARQFITLREKEDHDDLSFCTACEKNDKAELEFRTGNIDNGIMLSAELFSRKDECKYVPFETTCNCINILADAGYADKAAECFTIAEQELQTTTDDMSRIGLVAEMIKYLTKVDAEKAWDYFEEYADWSINCEDYYAFTFAVNVLPLLKNEEQRTLQVSSFMPWYKPDNVYNTADLYAYYHKQASDLAKRFDERHSTGKFSQQLNKAV